MLSASRRQPHPLLASAADRRQTWSMDKSWRCVTLSGPLRSRTVRCRWNPISCGTQHSGRGLSENDSAVTTDVCEDQSQLVRLWGLPHGDELELEDMRSSQTVTTNNQPFVCLFITAVTKQNLLHWDQPAGVVISGWLICVADLHRQRELNTHWENTDYDDDDNNNNNNNNNEKRRLEETQTLHAGCSKAEPKFFAPPQTPQGHWTAKI